MASILIVSYTQMAFPSLAIVCFRNLFNFSIAIKFIYFYIIFQNGI